MSITAIVLLIETVLVLLGSIGFLLFLRWKRKKSQTEQFDKLLNEVTAKKVERETTLARLLEEKYAVVNAEATESAAYMVEAEKQFLQYFLTQQVEQTPVTDFYQNLCELLDQYCYFIPAVNAEYSDTELDIPATDKDLETAEIDEGSQDVDNGDEVEATADDVDLEKEQSENLKESEGVDEKLPSSEKTDEIQSEQSESKEEIVESESKDTDKDSDQSDATESDENVVQKGKEAKDEAENAESGVVEDSEESKNKDKPK